MSFMNDANAVVQGLNQGRNALSGMLPGPMNAGGSVPQNMDPAAPFFDTAYRLLANLTAFLHQSRQEMDANKVAKLQVQLQHIKVERAKKYAEGAAGMMTGEAKSPLAAVGGLNAQGIPR